ncbi:MAG: CHASE2 domain-containing protein [Phycisphaerae bacterium]|nr:CHASE2 domain-containing protein [Phycisphaerae bacterium]
MTAGTPTPNAAKALRGGGGVRAAKLASVQLWLGFAITAVIALVQALGWTRAAEYPLYDLRMKMFNRFTAPPSDKVAVIMIDDPSIETVGKWPWPRGLLAEAIRELKRGGASVIALDLLHDDPQSLMYVARDPEGKEIESVDNDRLLAEAIGGHGGVIQGASFGYVDAVKAVARQKEKAARGVVRARFAEVWDALTDDPSLTLEGLRQRVLPDQPPTGAPIDDLLMKMTQVRTILAIEGRSGVPVPAEPARWPVSNEPSPPVPMVARSAKGVASVSFGGGDADGAVRRIPLWIQGRSRLYPTLGLAAAAARLGVPLDSVRVSARETELTLPSGSALTIPTQSAALKDVAELGELDGLMLVPWPRGGFGGWKSQFAVESSGGGLEESELPVGRLIDASRVVIPSIKANIANLDSALEALGAAFGIGDWKTYGPRAAEMAGLSPDEPRWRELYALQREAWLSAVRSAKEMHEGALDPSIDPATLTEEERLQLSALSSAANDAPRQIAEIERGLSRLDEWWNTDLPNRVRGRVCFIGWAATGALADFVETSVDPRTPGVLVHAAVTNAILNSVESPQFIAEAPAWINLVAVVVLGCLGTIIGVRLGVVQSPIVLIGALAVWFLVDGVVFWDWRNLFVVEAAPMAAALLGWLAVILHRLLVEQRGRRQTEARFRSYVSPDVVDILVNNPDLNSMAPQKRELTIFFSDIAGWTTITERIGTEGIAAFLATYLREMTDILQDNRATIDKYLGDGIMAFWGAPVEDPDHARHAVDAVIKMQEKLREMNEAGAFGAAGQVGVRIGLASGEVNVGDFGNPPHKSAYTVIGDSANLAARLESANKQFGSKILMTERTRSLAGMTAGVRLIGRVVVKGKTEPETLWEPIGTMKPKGERTADWVRLTTEAVQAYIDADFDRSLALFDRLEKEFEDHEMAHKYRDAIADVRERGGAEGEFKGTIVLSEK